MLKHAENEPAASTVGEPPARALKSAPALLALQRSAGNATTAAYVQRTRLLQRAPENKLFTNLAGKAKGNVLSEAGFAQQAAISAPIIHMQEMFRLWSPGLGSLANDFDEHSLYRVISPTRAHQLRLDVITCLFRNLDEVATYAVNRGVTTNALDGALVNGTRRDEADDVVERLVASVIGSSLAIGQRLAQPFSVGASGQRRLELDSGGRYSVPSSTSENSSGDKGLLK